MEIITLIVLIFISLFGYSAGSVTKARKFAELKPQIIDLIIVVLIWTGAIYSRIALDLNKWITILIWLILSIFIGILFVWPRKLSEENVSESKNPKENPKNLHSKILLNWKYFFNRVGNFQSRIMLSLFFFIIVTPFALAVKLTSDPLKLKSRRHEPFWLHRKENKSDIEQFMRQF